MHFKNKYLSSCLSGNSYTSFLAINLAFDVAEKI